MADQIAAYQLVQTHFEQFAVDYVDPASTPDTTGDTWDSAVAFEASAAAADATCRSAAHAAALSIIDPLLTEFVATHRAELDHAADHWADLQSQAVAQGYQGT